MHSAVARVRAAVPHSTAMNFRHPAVASVSEGVASKSAQLFQQKLPPSARSARVTSCKAEPHRGETGPPPSSCSGRSASENCMHALCNFIGPWRVLQTFSVNERTRWLENMAWAT